MRRRKETEAEKIARHERVIASEELAKKVLGSLGLPDTEESVQRIMVDVMTGRPAPHAAGGRQTAFGKDRGARKGFERVARVQVVN